MAKKRAFDRVLFTTVILLTGFGLVMVHSASAAEVVGVGGGLHPFLLRQAVAAGLGLLLLVAAMHVDYRWLARPVVVYALLGGVLVLLTAVLFGPELNGSHRWFRAGPLSFQPSELAKPVLVVFLAYQLDRKLAQVNQAPVLVPAAVACGVVAGLVLLQPDLGTAALLVTLVVLLLFLAGLAWRYLLTGAAAMLPVLWLLVVNVPYRRQRLLAFLDPAADPLGSGWQAHQSLIAIGSGGPLGRGLGEGVQKLHFLPYPQSDFIFSIVAEELGTLGPLALLVLFAVFLWRGVAAGLTAPDPFGRLLAWGLTGVVVLQALVNMGVAVALLPTKGIPLPFISYGGSSLVVTMTACGLLLNVSEHG
jgi:cell division protein FtsW